MSDSNMGEGGGAVVAPEPVKRKRRTTPRKSAPPVQGRKTLIAAVTACVIAVADLVMTVRFGIKLF